MTVVETILVFAAIPLAFVLLLALLIFVPGGRRRVRYKSGQPWNHEPVWYEPHPDGLVGGNGSHAALPAGSTAHATAGPLGGARGTW